MEDRELIAGRLRELSRTAYMRDILKCTDFLSLSEQAAYYELKREELPSRAVLYGGYDDAERRRIYFLPSYMEDMEEDGLPGISCIKAEPVNSKFADQLTHRDWLGSLMNLGIERAKTGDIITEGASAYIFCLDDMAEYICSELVRVKHTSVCCRAADISECRLRPEFREQSVNVASERADAVLSAVFNISRNTSAELIASEAVFSDGRLMRRPSASLKEGARISVKGYGKFIFEGISGSTKKGRLYINIKRFV